MASIPYREPVVAGFIFWGEAMTYRLIYNKALVIGADAEWRPAARTEEFISEHQALGRARELLEAGEHHGVLVDDGTGNVLCGVPLQLKLGGFAGE
jgi:hypothetical protein